jgi:divalent metal cation (Fe/Co/Zn/Cd) transporter
LEDAHRIGHEVSDRLREDLGLPDVLVHVEPPVPSNRVSE